jgi:predicted Co/Zn/Cd cation transporter (cation efflux family)
MNNFFLRLYVATKVHMTTRPEDGFVTAEHLALAVAGVVIVGVVTVAFKEQVRNLVDGLIKDATNAGK